MQTDIADESDSSTGDLPLDDSSDSDLLAGSGHEAACLAEEIVMCVPGAEGWADGEVGIHDEFFHGRFELLRRQVNKANHFLYASARRALFTL